MQSTLWLACVLNFFLASYAEAEAQRTSRIYGGASALAGEFKYVVGIGMVLGKNIALCTGGIVDEKFILTAAHCLTKRGKLNDDGTQAREFHEPLEILVYANTTNLIGSVVGASSELDRVVKRNAVKAYFLSEFFKNGIADIAILELESPLNLTNGYLQKLQLPSARNDYSFEDDQVVLAGFGVDKDVNDRTLKKAHFRVVPYSKCQYYNQAELYRQNSLCLTSITEDKKRPDHPLGGCEGDSGGPVVRGNTVIGILTNVSRLTCDARGKYPQKCMKVSYYKDFIDSVISKKSNDESITEFEIEV